MTSMTTAWSEKTFTSGVKKYLPLGAVVAALAALPVASAQATNGMVPHGNGAAAKGLSGAVTALALDTQAGSHNPAAMVLLGNRLDLELEFFAPIRDFTASAGGTLTGGTTESATEFFLIPAMGANWMIDDKSSTGITPVLAAQRIRTEGLEALDGVSVDRGSVNNNGYDHSVGYGFRVGWQGDFFRNLTIGASHQSRMYMTEFTKYAGLFAEQGDFDFAPISNLGIAYRATPNLTLALDWQHIWYNEIDAIANNGNVALAAGVLGGDDGAGFSWEDMDVVKFGIQWDTSDALTLRTGISYNSQTFNDDQVLFNIPAPGVVRIHASVGASCKISENHAVNFSFTRAFSDSVTGTTVNTGTQTIKLRMDQFDGVVGHTYSC